MGRDVRCVFAAFANQAGGNGTSARAVPGQPASGCGALNAGDIAGGTVLFQRGVCPFEEKALAAAAANSAAVVIVNTDDDLEKAPQMGATSDEARALQVPVVMIGKTDGALIADAISAAAEIESPTFSIVHRGAYMDGLLLSYEPAFRDDVTKMERAVLTGVFRKVTTLRKFGF
jgi:hypothetical protein